MTMAIQNVGKDPHNQTDGQVLNNTGGQQSLSPGPSPEKVGMPAPIADLECTTSEDEENISSRRRAPPRQSKKQKRAQKHLEVKEDRAVLVEMKNPIPSTSGPLIREQEKIRRMYPRKFLQLDLTTSQRIEMIDVTKYSRRETSKECKSNGEFEAFKNTGVNRKSAKIRKKSEENNTPPRRSSRRVTVTLNSDGEKRGCKSEEGSKTPQTPADSASLTPLTGKENADTLENFHENLGTCIGTPIAASTSPTPQNSSVSQIMDPVPHDKRQRRLSKRLMSPDSTDHPPVLLRIRSLGSVNIVDEDAEPPKLSPMLSPPTTKLRKTSGKENQLLGERHSILAGVNSTSSSATPVPEDCDPTHEGNYVNEAHKGFEPARKRFARSKSSTSGSVAIKNTLGTSKSPEKEGPKLRTSKRRSKI